MGCVSSLRPRSLTSQECFSDEPEGLLELEAQFTGVATSDEIIANDNVLTPSRYISYAEAATEIDGEPIQARYERLVGEAYERLAMLPQIEAAFRRELSLIEVADD